MERQQQADSDTGRAKDQSKKHWQASGTRRIESRTRQFAKRQHTWFRNLEECHPIAMTGTESPAELANRILTTADTGEPPA